MMGIHRRKTGSNGSCEDLVVRVLCVTNAAGVDGTAGGIGC